MQRNLILATFFSLLALFANSASAAQEGPSQWLDGYFADWETRDIHRIAPHYADNVSMFDLPSNSSTSGKKQVVELMQVMWIENAPDMKWIRTSPKYINGNTVAYEWLYTGTYNGMWGDVKVSNKPFAVKGISTTTFDKNGKIILHRDFYDLLSFQSQLGL
ncbi:nuclear transport factor 2 family protein [Thiomicrorhabdus sp.]|uniref:nuclear transport factor 2 family protein n=1 Tax=Thiomicrorhabdus sp. TaxID=2039724 RepID=UPI0029C8B4EC|nr:ester cyclase [Thiomicrorhabdus sp.]